MTAQFVNINSTEFSLNGIPFDKVFLAVPTGANSIRVVCTYDSNIVVLKPTNISDIEISGQTFTSVALLVSALKSVVYNPSNIGGGGGGVGFAGTKEHFLNLTGIDTERPELDYVAEAIQTKGAFTCLDGQIMVFYTQTVIGNTGDNFGVLKRWYRLKPNLTSIGGGTNEISPSFFMPDGRIEVTPSEDNASLFLNIGAVTNPDTVQSIFNEGTTGGAAWSVPGDVFVIGILNGSETIWYFTGGVGLWGGSDTGNPDYLTATVSMFTNLSEQPETASPSLSAITTQDTGSTIFLGNPLGNFCNMSAANTNENFSISLIGAQGVLGGNAIVLCDASSWSDWATVSDANFINDLGDFAEQTATVFELCVWFDGFQFNYILRQR